MTKLLSNLQTLYFDHDLSCVDINPSNGLIAISTAAIVHVYKPVKTSSHNKSVCWTWQFSNEIIADHSNVNSLSWGNDNELVIGTNKQLALVNIHRQDEYSNYKFFFIWRQSLPNPCYLVKFSRNSELIACISKYDKFIKFFYRTNFDIANTQFNLLYLKHSSYVTDLKFRFIDHSHQLGSPQGSRYNILYTISNDNYIRVFLSFEFQKSKKVQHWGSLKLSDSSLANGISERKFIKIIDNYFFDYMIKRSLERFQKHGILNESLNANLQSLSKLQSDLIMVANMQGNLSFYLVTNLNLNPPKSIFFKKLSFSFDDDDDSGGGCGGGESTLRTSSATSLTSLATVSSKIIQFPQNVFPSDPQFMMFSDTIKIPAKKARPKHDKVTFANFHEFNSQDDEVSQNGDIAFIIHNLIKKNLRFVYLKLDDFLQNLNYNELYNNYDELYINNLNRSITNLSIKRPNASNIETSNITTKTIPSSISVQQSTFTTLNAILGNKITGHNKSIQKLFKDLSGEACLSISRFNEHKLWIPLKLSGKITKHSSLARMTLQRKSVITTNSSIVSAVLLRRGDTIITYSAKHELVVWTTHDLEAKQIVTLKAVPDGDYGKMELLTFFHLPEYHHDYKYDVHYVIGIYKLSTLKDAPKYVTKAWEVNLQNNLIVSITIDNLISETETKTEGNNANFDIRCISPVDPVGWNISLDNYSRDILTVISSSGILKSYSVKLHKMDSSNSPTKITWINNCTIDTNIINASHIKGSSINKIAIANETKTKFYIYNTSYSILEFSQDFTNLKKESQEEDTICDIDWANITEKTFTSENNSRNTPCVLSIGFKHAVLLYTQLNFDYTNNLPAFAPIKKIDLSLFTRHVINDSMWLNNGLLCIGTGNQLFISDNYSKNSLTAQMIAQDNYTKKIIGDRSLNNNSIDSIFSLVEILNNTLPVYHPQIIIQCMYFGKISLVKKIFLKLFLYLRKVGPEDNTFNDDDEEYDDDAMTEDENESIFTSGSKRKEKKFQLKHLPRLLGFSVEEFYYRYSLNRQKLKLLSNSSRNSSASASALFLSNDFNNKKFNNKHKQNTRMTITDEQLYTTKNFKSWVKSLKEKLMEISLPILTRHQQITLLTIIESLEILDKYRALTSFQESSRAIRNSDANDDDDDDNDNDEEGTDLDFNGFNFLLGYKLYQSHIRTQAGLNMRDNLFGIHCKNKQVLLDIINGNISIHDESLNNGPSSISHSHNSKLTWVKCKRTGMVYWLTDQLLVQQFETIANNEFQNSVKNENLTYHQQLQRLNNGAMILNSPVNEDLPYFETSRTRNPINATLFYLALKKKSILIKLWRVCHGHPEQAKLIKFLSLDFENSEKNRISAVKNAFALLSKHRYYMASCFFLLADHLQDCVNVLIKKCNDVELAIAVARVYEFVNIRAKTHQSIGGDFSSHGDSFNFSSVGSYHAQADGIAATQKLEKRNFKGPIFTSILIDHLLPMALNDGNRWICTYIFWSLHEDKLALVALIKSPYEVLKENICNVSDSKSGSNSDADSEIGAMAKGAVDDNSDGAGSTDSFSYLDDVTTRSKFTQVLKAYEKEKNITIQLQQQKLHQSGKKQQQQQQQNQLVAHEKEIIVSNNNIFLKTDPILVIIYKELRNDMAKGGFFRNNGWDNVSYHIRDILAQYNKILSVFSQHEFQFIHRISLIYSRMGCDYLSIDLLRNWKFVDCLGIAKTSAAATANAAKDQIMFQLRDQQKQKQEEKDKKIAADTKQHAVLPGAKINNVENGSLNGGNGNGSSRTRLKPVSASAFQEFSFDDFGFGGGADSSNNNITSSSISQAQSKQCGSEQKAENKNEGKANDTKQDGQDGQEVRKSNKAKNQSSGLESKKSNISDGVKGAADENGNIDESKENRDDESNSNNNSPNDPFKNKAPPPKVAFEEPDLSAFDFGM